MKCISEQQGKSSVTDTGACVHLGVYPGVFGAGAGGRREHPQLPDIVSLEKPLQKENSEHCTSLLLKSYKGHMSFIWLFL